MSGPAVLGTGVGAAAVAAPLAGSGDMLAATGVAAGLWAAFGLALVVGGFVLNRLARRRAATR